MTEAGQGLLTLDRLWDIVEGGADYHLDQQTKQDIDLAYRFLADLSSHQVVYGINTGFGPMASYRVNEQDAKMLQYNLVRSHANGLGKKLTPKQIRGVMVCRLHSLALGRSGCSIELAEQLEAYLRHGIYPLINYHGGVGASGDLVQLAQLGLGLIGEGHCYYREAEIPVAQALSETGLKPLKLKLRDGLAILNGTSCMTAIAASNVYKARQLLQIMVRVSSYLNELTRSSDESFSDELNKAKRHHGQLEVARMMQRMTEGSDAILHLDHTELRQADDPIYSRKVQEVYSIRCIPQILGPILDTVEAAAEVVQNEMNSTSDNPIIDAKRKRIVHGGNFHGDYISLEMDKLKLGVVRLATLAERQLNFLMNDKVNEKFPPFLNSGVKGVNYGMQGLQFVATSTAAECQTLANSMYVHSVTCNNDNQDVVSMGMNSATLCNRVIENCTEVVAIMMFALAQATDCIKGYNTLSPAAKELYDYVRAKAPFLTADMPVNEQIEGIKSNLFRVFETLTPNG